MKIQILNKSKKKKFVEELGEFGVERIDEILIRSGKERIRAFFGDLSREKIMELWRLLPIEGIGLYVGKEIISRSGVREVRLSLDGMHLWEKQLDGRIVELSEEQEKKWFLGEDINLNENQIKSIGNLGYGGVDNKTWSGFVLVKAGKDFVGFGKIGKGGEILFSYLPKERRRKPKG